MTLTHALFISLTLFAVVVCVITGPDDDLKALAKKDKRIQDEIERSKRDNR